MKQTRTKKSSSKKQAPKPSTSRRFNQVRTWFKSLKKWQRVTLYALAALLSIYSVHKLVSASIPEVKNPQWGVSFSVKYAEELGVDWKKNFIALLDDMQIKNYRLMSHWNRVEPKNNRYDFKELDWQMDQVAKRGGSVSLAIGMRQPRWPECHKPDWVKDLPRKQEDKEIMEFTLKTVNRYKNHPALASYQLENEAVNSWFGSCTPDDIDQERLEKEFQAVKKADPKHPIYMSLSDQHGLPLNKPVPDRYGFSVYRVVWNNKTGPFKFYVTYPTPVWYHKLRAWWIKTFKDRDIFIHELQVEPWGPKATVGLTVEEQDRSMDPDQIRENIRFARKIGEPEIYTWGGEWWYWRKEKLKDPSIWEAVKTEFRRP